MFRQSSLVIVKFGLPDALAIGIVGADLAMTTAPTANAKRNGARQAGRRCGVRWRAADPAPRL